MGTPRSLTHNPLESRGPQFHNPSPTGISQFRTWVGKTQLITMATYNNKNNYYYGPYIIWKH
jgi:hypothetical protein